MKAYLHSSRKKSSQCLLVLCLFLISYTAKGQTSIQSGDWDISNNWNPRNAPAHSPLQGTSAQNIATASIAAGHIISRNGSINMGSYSALNVNANGRLDITGNLTNVANTSHATITVNGRLNVKGDLVFNANANNFKLVVNGIMVVDGNLVKEQNSGSEQEITVNPGGILIIQGSYQSNGQASNKLIVSAGTTEAMFIVGTYFHWGNGSNVNNGTRTFYAQDYSKPIPNQVIMKGFDALLNTQPDICRMVKNCATGMTPQPVDLLSFEVSTTVSGVLAQWKTVQEKNNAYFSVERSIDGYNWQLIGEVDGAGNSTSLTSYRLLDSNPPAGVLYYRLSQTDFDGTLNIHDVRAVFVKDARGAIRAYPNPAHEQVQINYMVPASEIKLYDLLGLQIKVEPAYTNDKTIINTYNLKPGTYLLQIGQVRERLIIN